MPPAAWTTSTCTLAALPVPVRVRHRGYSAQAPRRPNLGCARGARGMGLGLPKAAERFVLTKGQNGVCWHGTQLAAAHGSAITGAGIASAMDFLVYLLLVVWRWWYRYGGAAARCTYRACILLPGSASSTMESTWTRPRRMPTCLPVPVPGICAVQHGTGKCVISTGIGHAMRFQLGSSVAECGGALVQSSSSSSPPSRLTPPAP